MSGLKPWTDAEQLYIIQQLMPETIKWDSIKLPEGRTLRSCQTMMTGFKKRMAASGFIPNGGTGSAPATPKKAPRATPKKKKAPAKKPFDDSDNDGDQLEIDCTPKPKRKRSVSVKYEEASESDNDDDIDEDVASPRKKRKTKTGADPDCENLVHADKQQSVEDVEEPGFGSVSFGDGF